MECRVNRDDTKLQVKVLGRLDTMTAPELEKLLAEKLEGITVFELDLEELEYISSAGLRVLLAAQKQMNKQGSMIVKHVNDDVMDVLEVTGFTDILTIE